MVNANAYKSPKIILMCGTKDSFATLLRDPTIQSMESVSHKHLRLITNINSHVAVHCVFYVFVF